MCWKFPTDRNREPYVDKLKSPDSLVACPTCGRQLEYLSYGTAWEVRCPKCEVHIVMKGF